MHWVEEEEEEEDEREEEAEREREFVMKCEQQRGAQAVQQQKGGVAYSSNSSRGEQYKQRGAVAVQAEGRILRRSAMQCNADYLQAEL